MTALWIIGIIVLFFAFLLSIKAKVTIAYHDEVALWIKVLGIKIPILPAKKQKKGPHAMSAKKAKKLRERLRQKKLKKEAAKKKKEAEKKAKKEAAKASPKEQQKKSLTDILDTITLVRTLAAKVIGKFWKHLRIDIARIRIRVAMDDAAATAVAYGAVTAAVNTIFPILETVKNFKLPKEKDLAITADFVGDSIDADIELSFSLRVWHVLDVALSALFSFIVHQVKKLIKAEKKKASRSVTPSKSTDVSRKP